MQFLWARRPPPRLHQSADLIKTQTQKSKLYPNTRILGSWHIARANVAILSAPAASFANRAGVELLTWRHFLRTIYRRELEPGCPHGADGRPNGSSSSPLPWRRRFHAWTCKQFIHPAALEPPPRINVWTGLGPASISGTSPIWCHSSQSRKQF